MIFHPRDHRPSPLAITLPKRRISVDKNRVDWITFAITSTLELSEESAITVILLLQIRAEWNSARVKYIGLPLPLHRGQHQSPSQAGTSRTQALNGAAVKIKHNKQTGSFLIVKSDNNTTSDTGNKLVILKCLSLIRLRKKLCDEYCGFHYPDSDDWEVENWPWKNSFVIRWIIHCNSDSSLRTGQFLGTNGEQIGTTLTTTFWVSVSIWINIIW